MYFQQLVNSEVQVEQVKRIINSFTLFIMSETFVVQIKKANTPVTVH